MTQRSVNVIEPEIAERNADEEGGYTFNLFPPPGYQGPVFVFAVIGLGEHAHVFVETGTWTDTRPLRYETADGMEHHCGTYCEHPGPNGVHAVEDRVGYRVLPNSARAGKLVMKWVDWVSLRGLLEGYPGMRIAEVRNATRKQLEYYLGSGEGAIA